MAGPLTGIKVLDLTRILAGPFCTMTLGDLGADVVKVEHPDGGDNARGNGPFIDGLSSYFLSINRGKRSVTLDLSKERGREAFLALAEGADVVAENFKPGAMRKLGLSYDVLESRNPRLVYCAISGFGQDGPYAQYPALDVIVQGMGGVMSTTGEPGGPPVRPGASYGDIAAGLFAAIGILSALLERAVSGRGQFIDTSMLDCQVAVQENAFSRYFASGETPGPLGTRHPIYTPFQAFEASDGWIVVAIVGGRNDQWPLFCATIGRLDLIDDPDFGDGWLRTQHYGRLEPILSEAVRERTIAAWLDAFRSVGIACGPVNDLAQVANDPQVLARGMFVDVMEKGHGPIRLVNTPVKLSRTPGSVERLSPDLGEHTEEVLREWAGLAPGEIEALRRERAV